MKIQPYATILALCVLANGVAAHPRGAHEAVRPRTIHTSNEAATLRGFCDSSLESLRAGRIEAPARLGAEDRAELRAAETRSVALEDMRAGHIDFSEREWTMIAIGALIVLLIIIIA